MVFFLQTRFVETTGVTKFAAGVQFGICQHLNLEQYACKATVFVEHIEQGKGATILFLIPRRVGF